ncbi:C40 family peptidase [Aneurinibacillus aneurinilyticus]|jgi:cell wall-associated NlpC family hydrolase|uniref:NlpC/P60 family protein n=1 Tax=Aneurinibacillus aneurinilyticus ATCC 12856 TaxID=649747 RepID=U1WFP4_ANEAE|nr:NlpC/P60 family protein [Aneurinibacillus aneurinilyticus]ERI07359.1 NlpC/P60 family protein [Aneurinibacillus aneurinilyticus ATCC 12856]MCI1693060.1 NlpC/P60 family protein [Aneurinibacillus aneurinilyticus]MED0671658.1 NlpC/P60 family protein [Aneurinibacillus aneurinilyticus]MED0709373.1 NlpC/P60 family protein [Aneurinibacillus aneurinilyticus]MED0726008.1 NlpC/P60 family protein [Aneurinibacillus aneurinilyticus]
MKKLYWSALCGLLGLVSMGAGTVHAASYSSYKVKSGDTAYKISQRYTISLAKLKEINPGIEDLNQLYSGQTLNIPKADAIIALGKNYIGTPYVLGAKRFQDKTFDCSSFVQYLYAKQGISLGWNSREQAKQGVDVSFKDMKKGDLMFFADEDYPNETGLNKVRHVGIYMGDGKILHTYEEGTGVIVSDLYNDPKEGDYWYKYFLFAKRIIQ